MDEPSISTDSQIALNEPTVEEGNPAPYVLNVNCSQFLLGSNESVIVTWSCNKDYTEDDYIGVYYLEDTG